MLNKIKLLLVYFILFISIIFFNISRADDSVKFQLLYFDSSISSEPNYNNNEKYSNSMPLFRLNAEHNAFSEHKREYKTSAKSSNYYVEEYTDITVILSNNYKKGTVYYTNKSPYSPLFIFFALSFNIGSYGKYGKLDIGFLPSYNSSYKNNKIQAITGAIGNDNLGGGIGKPAFFSKIDLLCFFAGAGVWAKAVIVVRLNSI